MKQEKITNKFLCISALLCWSSFAWSCNWISIISSPCGLVELLHFRLKRHLTARSELTFLHRSGFMYDLLLYMSASLNFTYTLIRPPDGKWGIEDANGTWHGMLGQIRRKEVRTLYIVAFPPLYLVTLWAEQADFALGPFGVGYERKKHACDFTSPIVIDPLVVVTAIRFQQVSVKNYPNFHAFCPTFGCFCLVGLQPGKVMLKAPWTFHVASRILDQLLWSAHSTIHVRGVQKVWGMPNGMKGARTNATPLSSSNFWCFSQRAALFNFGSLWCRQIW